MKVLNICKAFVLPVMIICASPDAVAIDVISKNESIINQFKSELKQRLKAAMKQGGPSNAIQVCSKEAPQIASRLSEQHGVTLQRVSDRPRNSNNTLSQAQRKILAHFKQNPSKTDIVYEELNATKSLYAKVIKTESLCLSCHGESLSDEVSHTLKIQYPNDTAVGYKLGEVRGMFSIERDLEQDAELRIKNFKMLNQNLWVGGQPSANGIKRLKALGITTVINLRPLSEMNFDEARLAKQSGIHYINLPIDGAKDVNFDTSHRVRTIIDKSEGPVFLHCASSNRVGALLALDAFQNGSDKTQSLEMGRFSGMSSLGEHVATQLKKASEPR